MDISAVNRTSQPLDIGAVATPVEHAAQTRDIVQAVKAVNATEMFGQDHELVFQMDRQTRRMVVQVVDKNTKEVLSQIPPEYVLRLSDGLNQSKK
ncbi:MAG: flagellar protein FlaG [Acidobacteriia bacterium]|nr:flagellar protein FlaG [Terriglobia bacterium]